MAYPRGELVESPPCEASPLDLAWAAGFIDGEGSVGCYWLTKKGAGKKYRKLQLQVAQTRLQPLEKLRELFGGTISEINPKGKRQRTWYWGCRSQLVADVYCAVQPYLQVKGPDFEEAIQKYNSWPTSTRS